MTIVTIQYPGQIPIIEQYPWSYKARASLLRRGFDELDPYHYKHPFSNEIAVIEIWGDVES